jgi:protein O-GlcNAc transferase
VLLPGCYQPTDDKRPVAAVPSRAALGLPAAGVVFAALGNVVKLTPAVFDGWTRILTATPGSVLWLLAPSDAATAAEVAANLAKEAKRRGVDPARIVYAKAVPQADHIARLGLADIALDTRPYNAHTSASDALFAGIPVVTQSGRGFQARVARSVVTAHGFPELAVESAAAYEALAIRLANAPTDLAALKARIAAARKTSALFDTGRFRQHLESAYEQMWSKAAAGQKPAAGKVG